MALNLSTRRGTNRPHVQARGRFLKFPPCSEITIIGPDLAAGMRPQLLIPGGTFHTSRLRNISAPTGFALLGTTEWPGFESPDLELADPMKLVAAYPTLRREIEEFTRTQGAESV